jgi:hypothetical protein
MNAFERLSGQDVSFLFFPVENQPVWVDDERFDLDYHVRHVALPRPGADEQLKRLAADILSRPLDRSRPLWGSRPRGHFRSHCHAPLRCDRHSRGSIVRGTRFSSTGSFRPRAVSLVCGTAALVWPDDRRTL